MIQILRIGADFFVWFLERFYGLKQVLWLKMPRLLLWDEDIALGLPKTKPNVSFRGYRQNLATEPAMTLVRVRVYETSEVS